MKSIQLLIILLSFVQSAKIQIISQKLDLSDITLGDRVTYTLIVEHDKNTRLLSPKPISIASEHSETDGPKAKRLKSKAKGRGKIWESIEYQLTVYEPGTYSIPPLIIKCIAANGREFSVMSKSMEFKVRGIRPKGSRKIKDIKGAESIPRNAAPYVLILGIIVVGLSVASYLYFRKRKPFVKVEPETVILQRLPHEIVLEELREIEMMDLVAKGEIKEYYTRISEVIRHYFEKVYGIDVLELTTSKLLGELESILERSDLIVADNNVVIREISGFLNACDAVKFAKYQPSMDEAENLLQQARGIVELVR